MLISAAALLRCKTTLWLVRWLSWGWLSDVLFSKNPKQKTLGLRYLVAVANCMAGVIALNMGASMGVIDPEGSRQLTYGAITTILVFYIVMRLGWNLKLADPSMSEPKMMSAIGFLAWGYLIGGPGSVVALMLLFIILMFGLFTVSPWQLIRSSAFAAVAFALVFTMASAQHADKPDFVRLQMIYFGVLVIMLISVCLLVSQLARLRGKLTQQKNDLASALCQIRELAIRDELTGLFNRRHMLAVMETERQRIERHHGHGCLALIDVDHFKGVNDQWGHGAGDEVLRSMAEVVTACLRETDVVARWGGEEFLILFTDSDCDTATQVLTRIRQTLAKTVVSPSVPDLRVTFSAGMSSHRPQDTIAATLEQADQALYQAKAAGRNITLSHAHCKGR
ncbi:MAG: GGDEF domain-containing protein [Pseudomonadota bacterium]